MGGWTIQEGGARRTAPSQTTAPKRKVPYTPKYRIKEDTPPDQRKTMELINLMIDVLKENDLMMEKQ